MISIKPVNSGHLSSLGQLYDELMGTMTNSDKLMQTYQSIANNENYVILGAFNQDELVGSLMGIICQDLVGDCRPFMVVENVIVSNRARRQGVGTKLMQEIEWIARARDCSYMIFVSGEQRKEAHIFYEKLGFKEENVEGYRKHF